MDTTRVLRAALALTVIGGAVSAQWINEIHYDNAGGDVGEFFEIAGPAGTDLTGWSVEGYNGATGSVYDTISLSGTIPDQGCPPLGPIGFGAVSFAFPSMQNGAPDGLALIAADGTTVVEFISYEGSFMAVTGNASGMTSVDIGVAESGTTPIGFSLQLTGLGKGSSEFTWATEMAETPGAVNTGQTIAPLAVSTFRNGGTNPASYTATALVLGGTFTATVDLSTTGHTTALLVGFDTALSVTLGGGQTLLCLDTVSAGEVFTGAGLPLVGFPIAMASVPVPNNASICGRTFSSQALHVFGVVPFALSNAYDHTPGAP